MSWSSQAFLQPCEVKEKVPSDSIFCLHQLLSGGLPKGPGIVQCTNMHLMLGLDYQCSQRGDNTTEATERVWGGNGELAVYWTYSAEKFPKYKPSNNQVLKQRAFTPSPKDFQVQTPHKSWRITSFKTENPLGKGFS